RHKDSNNSLNFRSYKNGHIWQDLTDNDLITPFSDNEYILKGSLIPSPHNKAVEQFFPFHERKTATKKQDAEEEEEEEEIADVPILKTPYETLHIEANVSPKPPPRGDEESPIRPDTSSSSSSVLKSERTEEMKEGDKEKSCGKLVAIKKNGSQVDRSNSKGRGEAQPRRRAADVLRNLLRCRLVDTKDTVKRESRGMNGSLSRKSYQTSSSSNERKNWEKRGSNGRSRQMTEKTTSATFKPSKEPNCSQCGKPFKPEKLHSHMKSCIALSERGKSSSLNKETQTGTKRPSKVTVTVL
ncbi:uncharacterized protein LOC110027893, partial [Phalaenopsis equestris]|uniref:uncharacterized protein LOC110027893 n=1 Tax=Phalaenopsis equestris TaxID=78828 RepID=UPI0009E481F6